jgi:hypothetical protein
MKQVILLAVLGLLFLAFTGCVQMPTEKQGVADMRPQISFVADRQYSDALVYIDDAQMGRVGDFIDGRSALRILPGTHELRVVSGGSVLLNERFYIGDGVSRSFVIR